MMLIKQLKKPLRQVCGGISWEPCKPSCTDRGGAVPLSSVPAHSGIFCKASDFVHSAPLAVYSPFCAEEEYANRRV